MANAYKVRSGSSGPVFDGDTNDVLTMNADGTASFKPAAGGVVTASDVVNDSDAPGASVADALDVMASSPSFVAETNLGNSGAAIAVNFAISLAKLLTLTANCTLTPTNLQAGRTQWAQLRIVQGGAGSFTLTIAGAKVAGGTLVLSTAVGAVDIVNIYWNGSVAYAAVGGLNFV